MKEFNQNQSKKHDEIQIWCYENIKEIITSASNKVHSESEIEIISLEIEKPIIKQSYNGKNIVGYLDLYCSFFFNESKTSVLIEVKPEIFSLGDLIRQVKTYRTHMNNIASIVVSKNDNYKDILLDQGIRFFKYQH